MTGVMMGVVNEKGWLKSTSAYLLLECLRSQYGDGWPGPWARKLRLFACSLVRDHWAVLADERSRKAVEASEAFADLGSGLTADHGSYFTAHSLLGHARNAAYEAAFASSRSYTVSWTKRAHDLTSSSGEHIASVATGWGAANAADYFRDVVGNPFRKTALPVCEGCYNVVRHGPAGQANWAKTDCPVCKGSGVDAPWVTPEVLSLAQAAYDERVQKTCVRCEGRKLVPCRSDYWDEHTQDRGLPAADCPDCRGVGTFPSGQLDAFRLSLVADAAEEAGCPVDVTERCEGCDGLGWYNDLGPNTFAQTCPRCGGEGGRKTTNPLIHHLRSPGPHVRGCWALDLILGKE